MYIKHLDAYVIWAFKEKNIGLEGMLLLESHEMV